MQLSRASMIVLVLAVTATAQRPEAPCERLVVDHGRLAIATSDSSREILSDGRGIDLPRWSPDHRFIAYAREFRFQNGDPRSELVVIDRRGALVKEIPVTEEHGINAIVNLGWLGEGRLWTEGHATPSTSIYHEWDVKSARSGREVWGSWFAPAPDGKSLAYVAFVPHGAPPPHDTSRVMIGDVQVYPAAGAATRHVVKHLTWADDTLVFVDETPGGVALTGVNGRSHAITAALPLSATPALVAPGEVAGTIDLVVNGQALIANLRDGTLTPVVRRPHTAANAACQ